MQMKNADSSWRVDLEEQARRASYRDGIARARRALNAGGVANARLALIAAATTEYFAQTAAEAADIREVARRARIIWPGTDLSVLPYPAGRA